MSLMFFQESYLCVLKKAYVRSSWACWDEKKGKYKKFEGIGFAFEVSPVVLCLCLMKAC